MKDQSHDSPIDPELEARIVALMLGEASDFERDQLNLLIAERPELAAFKEQIESVHGLLQDIGTGESVADDDDWKLSADKRGKVLAVIRGEPEQQPANHVLNMSAERNSVAKANLFWTLGKIAAVLCVTVSLGIMLTPAILSRRTLSEARDRQIGLAVPADRDSLEASEHWSRPQSSVERFSRNGSSIVTADERRAPRPAGRPAGESSPAKDPQSALSNLRETLDTYATLPSPYYLRDDVQYFPAGPEFKLPRETAAPQAAREAKPNRAATAGMSGDELSLQKSESRAPIAKGQVPWENRPSADGEPQPESTPVPQQGDNAEFSGPMIANGRRFDDFEAAESAGSSISVPDAGTILLGGVKRPGSGNRPREESATPNQRYDSDGDGDGAGIEGEAPVAAAESRSRFNAAEQSKEAISFGDDIADINARQSGQGQQQSSQGQQPAAPPSRPSTGTDLQYSLDMPDSPVAGPGVGINGAWGSEQQPTDGKSSGGRGFGGGGAGGGWFSADGTLLADENKKLSLPEYERLEAAQSQSGIYRGTTPPAVPQPPNPAAAAESVSSTIADTEQKENRPVDPKDFGSGIARSMPSPLPQPQLPREQDNEQGQAEVTGRSAKPFANGRVTMPGEVIMPEDGLQGRPLPVPITGTAMGEPAGELPSGQLEIDGRLGYEYRAKDSLEKLKELNPDFISGFDENGDGVEETEGARLWSRSQARRAGERDESPRQDGRSANAIDLSWNGYVPPALNKYREASKTPPAKKAAAPAGLNEKSAADEAFSTFSLHVSDVSFKLARAALAQGEWPEQAKIRIEEFINAFDYGDPLPCEGEQVACRLEQSIHPFLQQRNLLRVAMRTAATGRSSNTPLRLTFLLDNSGSMERIDRAQTVRRAFALLAQQLKPIDQVTLISFARQPRLLADKVSGSQAGQLVGLIEALPSEGGTNLEAALQVAFEKAKEQQLEAAQNRIILLTDGAVNLGDANPQSLARMITSLRDAGIAFDAAGISAEGLNDEILEALTRQGDGRYYLLDSIEAAEDGFARQIAGALRPSAKNVKVQVEFNPRRVGRYKLLGFEKHRLKQEDFRDDKVDAAEMAAAEAGVALYQFEAKPDGEGDVGSVSVRFRDLSTGQMIENRWPIPYEPAAPRPDQAAPSMRIATAAALLAAKLRGEPLGETVELNTLSNLVAGLPDRVRNAERVGQLQLMIEQARQVSGQ
jgi:Mg-chelatase subunit ChlD